MEEYWLKCGLKENGELVCVRTLSNKRPDKRFYYTEEGTHKEVQNSDVIRLSREAIDKLRQK
jgi:hypothetical protein